MIVHRTVKKTTTSRINYLTISNGKAIQATLFYQQFYTLIYIYIKKSFFAKVVQIVICSYTFGRKIQFDFSHL